MDDLNSPAGAVPDPCPTPTAFIPTYDQAYGSFGELAGTVSYWHRVGRFAVRSGVEEFSLTDTLFECHSQVRLRLPLNALASNKAVVYQTRSGKPGVLHGLSLPTLRSFEILKPKGVLVALSSTTLYTIDRGSLWEGALARP